MKESYGAAKQQHTFTVGKRIVWFLEKNTDKENTHFNAWLVNASSYNGAVFVFW